MNKTKVHVRTLTPAAAACVAGVMSLASDASAQALTIYDSTNQTGPSGGCSANQVYVGSAIPNNLNNKISSFKLLKGYGVVFGINNDNVGDGKCWVAYSGDRYQNVPTALNNAVSFIRVFPIDDTVQKKGFAGGDKSLANAVNATWYYNWSGGESSTASLEYVAMKWDGGGSVNFATTMQTKAVANLLTFNEPDGADQADMTVATALDRYEELLVSGLRMGSPVCRQDGYKTWLLDFMDQSRTRGLRVDFLAGHWYDWGNENANSTSAQIKDRMAAKMTDLRSKCGSNMNVWLTEYNANPARTSAQNGGFITSAAGWINNTDWMERHSYFGWGGGSAFGGASSLTAAGQAYRDASTVDSNYGGGNSLGL